MSKPGKYSDDSKLASVTFSWNGDGEYVEIRGSFGLPKYPDWKPMAMAWSDELGKFYITLKLEQGKFYQYKYVVDGKWVCDMNSETSVDASGNLNNILYIPYATSNIKPEFDGETSTEDERYVEDSQIDERQCNHSGPVSRRRSSTQQLYPSPGGQDALRKMSGSAIAYEEGNAYRNEAAYKSGDLQQWAQQEALARQKPRKSSKQFEEYSEQANEFGGLSPHMRGNDGRNRRPSQTENKSSHARSHSRSGSFQTAEREGDAPRGMELQPESSDDQSRSSQVHVPLPGYGYQMMPVGPQLLEHEARPGSMSRSSGMAARRVSFDPATSPENYDGEVIPNTKTPVARRQGYQPHDSPTDPLSPEECDLIMQTRSQVKSHRRNRFGQGLARDSMDIHPPPVTPLRLSHQTEDVPLSSSRRSSINSASFPRARKPSNASIHYLMVDPREELYDGPEFSSQGRQGGGQRLNAIKSPTRRQIPSEFMNDASESDSIEAPVNVSHKHPYANAGRRSPGSVGRRGSIPDCYAQCRVIDDRYNDMELTRFGVYYEPNVNERRRSIVDHEYAARPRRRSKPDQYAESSSGKSVIYFDQATGKFVRSYASQGVADLPLEYLYDNGCAMGPERRTNRTNGDRVEYYEPIVSHHYEGKGGQNRRGSANSQGAREDIAVQDYPKAGRRRSNPPQVDYIEVAAPKPTSILKKDIGNAGRNQSSHNPILQGARDDIADQEYQKYIEAKTRSERHRHSTQVTSPTSRFDPAVGKFVHASSPHGTENAGVYDPKVKGDAQQVEDKSVLGYPPSVKPESHQSAVNATNQSAQAYEREKALGDHYDPESNMVAASTTDSSEQMPQTQVAGVTSGGKQTQVSNQSAIMPSGPSSHPTNIKGKYEGFHPSTQASQVTSPTSRFDLTTGKLVHISGSPQNAGVHDPKSKDVVHQVEVNSAQSYPANVELASDQSTAANVQAFKREEALGAHYDPESNVLAAGTADTSGQMPQSEIVGVHNSDGHSYIFNQSTSSPYGPSSYPTNIKGRYERLHPSTQTSQVVSPTARFDPMTGKFMHASSPQGPEKAGVYDPKAKDDAQQLEDKSVLGYPPSVNPEPYQSIVDAANQSAHVNAQAYEHEEALGIHYDPESNVVAAGNTDSSAQMPQTQVDGVISGGKQTQVSNQSAKSPSGPSSHPTSIMGRYERLHPSTQTSQVSSPNARFDPMTGKFVHASSPQGPENAIVYDPKAKGNNHKVEAQSASNYPANGKPESHQSAVNATNQSAQAYEREEALGVQYDPESNMVAASTTDSSEQMPQSQVDGVTSGGKQTQVSDQTAKSPSGPSSHPTSIKGRYERLHSSTQTSQVASPTARLDLMTGNFVHVSSPQGIEFASTYDPKSKGNNHKVEAQSASNYPANGKPEPYQGAVNAANQSANVQAYKREEALGVQYDPDLKVIAAGTEASTDSSEKMPQSELFGVPNGNSHSNVFNQSAAIPSGLTNSLIHNQRGYSGQCHITQTSQVESPSARFDPMTGKFVHDSSPQGTENAGVYDPKVKGDAQQVEEKSASNYPATGKPEPYQSAVNAANQSAHVNAQAYEHEEALGIHYDPESNVVAAGNTDSSAQMPQTQVDGVTSGGKQTQVSNQSAKSPSGPSSHPTSIMGRYERLHSSTQTSQVASPTARFDPMTGKFVHVSSPQGIEFASTYDPKSKGNNHKVEAQSASNYPANGKPEPYQGAVNATNQSAQAYEREEALGVQYDPESNVVAAGNTDSSAQMPQTQVDGVTSGGKQTQVSNQSSATPSGPSNYPANIKEVYEGRLPGTQTSQVSSPNARFDPTAGKIVHISVSPQRTKNGEAYDSKSKDAAQKVEANSAQSYPENVKSEPYESASDAVDHSASSRVQAYRWEVPLDVSYDPKSKVVTSNAELSADSSEQMPQSQLVGATSGGEHAHVYGQSTTAHSGPISYPNSSEKGYEGRHPSTQNSQTTSPAIRFDTTPGKFVLDAAATQEDDYAGPFYPKSKDAAQQVENRSAKENSPTLKPGSYGREVADARQGAATNPEAKAPEKPLSVQNDSKSKVFASDNLAPAGTLEQIPQSQLARIPSSGESNQRSDQSITVPHGSRSYSTNKDRYDKTYQVTQAKLFKRPTSSFDPATGKLLHASSPQGTEDAVVYDPKFKGDVQKGGDNPALGYPSAVQPEPYDSAVEGVNQRTPATFDNRAPEKFLDSHYDPETKVFASGIETSSEISEQKHQPQVVDAASGGQLTQISGQFVTAPSGLSSYPNNNEKGYEGRHPSTQNSHTTSPAVRFDPSTGKFVHVSVPFQGSDYDGAHDPKSEGNVQQVEDQSAHNYPKNVNSESIRSAVENINQKVTAFADHRVPEMPLGVQYDPKSKQFVFNSSVSADTPEKRPQSQVAEVFSHDGQGQVSEQTATSPSGLNSYPTNTKVAYEGNRPSAQPSQATSPAVRFDPTTGKFVHVSAPPQGTDYTEAYDSKSKGDVLKVGDNSASSYPSASKPGPYEIKAVDASQQAVTNSEAKAPEKSLSIHYDPESKVLTSGTLVPAGTLEKNPQSQVVGAPSSGENSGVSGQTTTAPSGLSNYPAINKEAHEGHLPGTQTSQATSPAVRFDPTTGKFVHVSAPPQGTDYTEAYDSKSKGDVLKVGDNSASSYPSASKPGPYEIKAVDASQQAVTNSEAKAPETPLGFRYNHESKVLASGTLVPAGTLEKNPQSQIVGAPSSGENSGVSGQTTTAPSGLSSYPNNNEKGYEGRHPSTQNSHTTSPAVRFDPSTGKFVHVSVPFQGSDYDGAHDPKSEGNVQQVEDQSAHNYPKNVNSESNRSAVENINQKVTAFADHRVPEMPLGVQYDPKSKQFVFNSSVSADTPEKRPQSQVAEVFSHDGQGQVSEQTATSPSGLNSYPTNTKVAYEGHLPGTQTSQATSPAVRFDPTTGKFVHVSAPPQGTDYTEAYDSKSKGDVLKVGDNSASSYPSASKPGPYEIKAVDASQQAVTNSEAKAPETPLGFRYNHESKVLASGTLVPAGTLEKNPQSQIVGAPSSGENSGVSGQTTTAPSGLSSYPNNNEKGYEGRHPSTQNSHTTSPAVRFDPSTGKFVHVSVPFQGSDYDGAHDPKSEGNVQQVEDQSAHNYPKNVNSESNRSAVENINQKVTAFADHRVPEMPLGVQYDPKSKQFVFNSSVSADTPEKRPQSQVAEVFSHDGQGQVSEQTATSPSGLNSYPTNTKVAYEGNRPSAQPSQATSPAVRFDPTTGKFVHVSAPPQGTDYTEAYDSKSKGDVLKVGDNSASSYPSASKPGPYEIKAVDASQQAVTNSEAKAPEKSLSIHYDPISKQFVYNTAVSDNTRELKTLSQIVGAPSSGGHSQASNLSTTAPSDLSSYDANSKEVEYGADCNPHAARYSPLSKEFILPCFHESNADIDLVPSTEVNKAGDPDSLAECAHLFDPATGKFTTASDEAKADVTVALQSSNLSENFRVGLRTIADVSNRSFGGKDTLSYAAFSAGATTSEPEGPPSQLAKSEAIALEEPSLSQLSSVTSSLASRVFNPITGKFVYSEALQTNVAPSNVSSITPMKLSYVTSGHNGLYDTVMDENSHGESAHHVSTSASEIKPSEGNFYVSSGWVTGATQPEPVHNLVVEKGPDITKAKTISEVASAESKYYDAKLGRFVNGAPPTYGTTKDSTSAMPDAHFTVPPKTSEVKASAATPIQVEAYFDASTGRFINGISGQYAESVSDPVASNKSNSTKGSEDLSEVSSENFAIRIGKFNSTLTQLTTAPEAQGFGHSNLDATRAESQVEKKDTTSQTEPYFETATGKIINPSENVLVQNQSVNKPFNDDGYFDITTGKFTTGPPSKQIQLNKPANAPVIDLTYSTTYHEANKAEEAPIQSGSYFDMITGKFVTGSQDSEVEQHASNQPEASAKYGPLQTGDSEAHATEDQTHKKFEGKSEKRESQPEASTKQYYADATTLKSSSQTAITGILRSLNNQDQYTTEANAGNTVQSDSYSASREELFNEAPQADPDHSSVAAPEEATSPKETPVQSNSLEILLLSKTSLLIMFGIYMVASYNSSPKSLGSIITMIPLLFILALCVAVMNASAWIRYSKLGWRYNADMSITIFEDAQDSDSRSITLTGTSIILGLFLGMSVVTFLAMTSISVCTIRSLPTNDCCSGI